MSDAQSILKQFKRLGIQRKSGTLSFERIDGLSIVISYNEGRVAAASSNLAPQRLGQYLTRDGWLDERRLNALLRYAKRHRMMTGEAAVRHSVLGLVELSAIVRRQAIFLIKTALNMQFEMQSFTASKPSLYCPAEIGFEHLLLELARANPCPFKADDDSWMVFDRKRDLSHLPWYPEELFVLGELRLPHTLKSLCEATRIEINSLRAMLNVFHSLRLLKILRMSSVEPETTALIRRVSFPLQQLIPEATHASVSEKLEAYRNRASLISEQFKNLKVQVMEAARSNRLKILTVSSPEVRDGKSLVSANLASCFSIDSSQRVIIVDCDLRRPSLNKYLGVPPGPGLLDYLEGGTLPPHCYIRRLQNLYFVTAGRTAESSVELLSSPRMKAFIDYLASEFDLVILDAPPFAQTPDARVISGLSDRLVMTVRMGKTSFDSFKKALRVVDRDKILGVVFNDVQSLPFHGYNSYAYSGR